MQLENNLKIRHDNHHGLLIWKPWTGADVIQVVILFFTLIATFWCLMWSIATERRLSATRARRRVAALDNCPFIISSPETYERRYGSKLPF